MVRHTSIRVLLALEVEFDMELEQLYVKIAVQKKKKNLDEQIYMSHSKGFAPIENEDKVCLLKKILI